ncbi:MAG TPA: YidC/Oxa1 family membrane protein insertase [Solirubrobacteraceae bacterium]
MPFVGANIIQDIFSPLIAAFDWVIQLFHSIGFGWGGSIIALTIVVRTLMLPLTIKQFRSMQALQTLQPEIKALQAKYKDDKQRLNQEMMAFYQENKVNPFGSCLPLVLQIPVFISLFYMLRTDLKVDICGPKADILKVAAQQHTTLATTYCDAVVPGSAKFLFIPDLTAPATGGVLVVLLVLYIGSQLLSSILMSVTADKNQRYLMIGLPFVFVLFIKGFPAGLLVYWITTNLWTVGQQYFIRRSTGQLPAFLGGNGGVTASAAVAPPKRSAKSEDSSPKGGTDAKGAASTNGAGKSAKGESKAPVAAGPPPPSPRKKKKRSGRRR